MYCKACMGMGYLFTFPNNMFTIQMPCQHKASPYFEISLSLNLGHGFSNMFAKIITVVRWNVCFFKSNQRTMTTFDNIATQANGK